MNSLNPFEWYGAPYLVFYTIMCVVAIGIANLVKMQVLGKLSSEIMTTNNEGETIARDLDAYEAAALQGGSERVLACALATLSSHDLITLDATARSIQATETKPINDLHPVERAIMQRLKGGDLSIETAKTTIYPEMGDINHRIRELGLIPTSEEIAMSRFLPMLVLMVVATTLALPKVVIGLSLHKPVILLFLEMFLFNTGALMFCKEQSETTGKGDVVLRAMRQSGSALRLTSTSNPSALSLTDTAFAYALFGGVAIAADPYAQAMRLMKPQYTGGSSGGGCGTSSGCGGGGGSCGGGGCGGGCGGCGG